MCIKVLQGVLTMDKLRGGIGNWFVPPTENTVFPSCMCARGKSDHTSTEIFLLSQFCRFSLYHTSPTGNMFLGTYQAFQLVLVPPRPLALPSNLACPDLPNHAHWHSSIEPPGLNSLLHIHLLWFCTKPTVKTPPAVGFAVMFGLLLFPSFPSH